MKKFTFLMAILALGSVVIMYSCSSGGGNQTTEEATTTEQEEAVPETTVDPEAVMMARGEELYQNLCIACHQEDGKGLPNAFPSLIGSTFLLETPVMAAAQTLNGSEAVPGHGDIEYPVPMPPQLDNKEDAVAVINYVLQKYNDSEVRISVDDLSDITINPR